MNKTYKKCCAAAILLLNTLTLIAGNVSIKFAQNVSHASTEAYLVNATTAQEEKLTPASDSFTYTVPSGSSVKLKVTPDQGYVVYVWQKGASESNLAEIRESYSSTEQTLKSVGSDLVVTADVCKLVPATFVVPKEGSLGAEVNVEEQGDFGRLIAPEADGITYMLPEGRGAYFDPRPADGYNILVWKFEDNSIFPSHPDQFYKNNVPSGFYLTVAFYKDGETRTVTYRQPHTAQLTCYNRSEYDSPVIASGTTVTPGDQILFEVAPPDNPSGKVSVHHWLVNGKPYTDASGEYFTDNSLTLMAIDNLDVEVVPEAEYTGVTAVELQGLTAVASASDGTISVTAGSGTAALYSLQGACLGQKAIAGGQAVFHVDGASKGSVYIVVVNGQAVKVMFQ